jgi:WD40 repeat protein
VTSILLALALAAGSEEPRVLAGHTEAVLAVAFSPDGKLVASGSFDRSIRVHDAASGMSQKVLKGHAGPVVAVAFSPDATKIASASIDGHLKLWDLETSKELADYASPAELGGVAIVQGGKGVFITDLLGNGTMLAWDGAKLTAGKSVPARTVEVSRDGKWLVCGTKDDTIQLYDATTLARGKVINTKGHSPYPAASPEGDVVVSRNGHENDVKLWSLATQKPLGALAGHAKGVTSLTFGADGKTVWSGSEDHTVRQWDLKTKKQLRSIDTKAVPFLTASRDGKQLAIADGPMVKVYAL